jgi:tripartite-type tricarboxylate transporter receptor subunit TctC
MAPFGVGGHADAFSRQVALFLSHCSGRPVVVENRPGGCRELCAVKSKKEWSRKEHAFYS